MDFRDQKSGSGSRDPADPPGVRKWMNRIVELCEDFVIGWFLKSQRHGNFLLFYIPRDFSKARKFGVGRKKIQTRVSFLFRKNFSRPATLCVGGLGTHRSTIFWRPRGLAASAPWMIRAKKRNFGPKRAILWFLRNFHFFPKFSLFLMIFMIFIDRGGGQKTVKKAVHG